MDGALPAIETGSRNELADLLRYGAHLQMCHTAQDGDEFLPAPSTDEVVAPHRA